MARVGEAVEHMSVDAAWLTISRSCFQMTSKRLASGLMLLSVVSPKRAAAPFWQTWHCRHSSSIPSKRGVGYSSIAELVITVDIGVWVLVPDSKKTKAHRVIIVLSQSARLLACAKYTFLIDTYRQRRLLSPYSGTVGSSLLSTLIREVWW